MITLINAASTACMQAGSIVVASTPPGCQQQTHPAAKIEQGSDASAEHGPQLPPASCSKAAAGAFAKGKAVPKALKVRRLTRTPW
jgi:hypothetical protein